jgi:hypothetical protein
MTAEEAYRLFEDMYSMELAEPEAMAALLAAITRDKAAQEGSL